MIFFQLNRAESEGEGHYTSSLEPAASFETGQLLNEPTVDSLLEVQVHSLVENRRRARENLM